MTESFQHDLHGIKRNSLCQTMFTTEKPKCEFCTGLFAIVELEAARQGKRISGLLYFEPYVLLTPAS